MPRLPPSKVAALLGISDKTVVRAVNRGDLRDYQQRHPQAPVPQRGPRFILVDLEEAHHYFHNKGLLGRVPTPESEIVSQLLADMSDVKQELAAINTQIRTSSPRQTTQFAFPFLRSRHERGAPPGPTTTPPPLESPVTVTELEPGEDENSRAVEEPDRTPPLIAFAADKISKPRAYRGARTVPLRSEVTYVASKRELPPGSVKPRNFGDLHNVARGTLISQIQERRVSSHAIQTFSRDQRLDRWLTPEDQQSVLNHWNVVGTRYRPCPDCPHALS